MIEYKFSPLTFRWVSPDKIPAVWHIILPGVHDIIRKARNTLDWDVLQLYQSLVAGQAVLFIAKCVDKYAGFIVLRPFWRGNRLFVWLLYADPSVRFNEDVWQSAINFLESVAREIGAKALEMETTRAKGWERKLKFYNFKPVTTFFMKEVN